MASKENRREDGEGRRPVTGASPRATLKVVDRGRNRKNIAHAVLVSVCPCCGRTHESPVFTVKKRDAWVDAWRRGVHVQGFCFWPELSPAEREEFFISGICDKCWPKEEEEDDA